jgi:F-type H+-transporting ATPase subunit epsilon
MSIRCEIISQDRVVFQGDADMIILPGTGGELGVLPHHAPVLTTLKLGVVKIRREGTDQVFAVSGGVAEVQPDLVTVLADAAENVEEIDIKRADSARKRAEEALAKGIPPGSDALLNIEAALRRSNLRLEVARRYRKTKTQYPGQ